MKNKTIISTEVSVDKIRDLGFGLYSWQKSRFISASLAKELAKEEKAGVIAKSDDWAYALIEVAHKNERWSITTGGALRESLSEHLDRVAENTGCSKEKVRVRPLSLSLWP
jgi:hypothetical protein